MTPTTHFSTFGVCGFLLACLFPVTLFAGGEGLKADQNGGAPAAYRVKKVVIDAGHGGHDHGCSGKSSKEKHVALAIALQVGEYIEEYLPDVEVIYTRDKDVFVELHERAAIANRAQADVFISIHCNANPSTKPYGTETYVMGLHRNEAHLAVAKRENEVIMLEDGFNQHYDGFDPFSPTAHIIFSLFQGAHVEQSIELAGRIEEQFAERVGRKSRGVKQAGFLVLYKTAMPAVLIETGFLTNSGEENFLNSSQGKEFMASAIFRAFRDYKLHTENQSRAVAEGGPVNEPLAEPVVEKVAPEPAPNPKPIATETGKEKPTDPVPAKAEPAKEAVAQVAEGEKEQPVPVAQTPKNPPANPGTLSPPPSETNLPAEDDPVAFAQTATPHPEGAMGEATGAPTPAEGQASAPQNTKSAEPEPQNLTTVYRIQVYASHRKYASTDPLFKPLQSESLFRAQEGNLYKYMVGQFSDREEAVAKQAALRDKGYHDCFIVSQPYAVLAGR